MRSTKLCLPHFFSALVKGTDPDRMKGALHVLWNKGIGTVCDFNDRNRFADYCRQPRMRWLVSIVRERPLT